MPTAQYPNLSDRAVIGVMLQELEAALAASWVPQVANRFDSVQDTETYAGAGNAPPMREWVGGKHVKAVNEYNFTITNKDFESTLRMFRKDLRRDKTAQLRVKAADLARRAVEHEGKLISDLILAGEAGTLGTAYDGQFFFDTDHSVGSSGTMSNDINGDISAYPVTNHGTTTAPSVGEAAFAIQDGIKQLYGLKDDQGEPINTGARSFAIMTGVGLWSALSNALSVDVFDGGDTNFLRRDGLTKSIIMNPRLTWTTKFAVFVQDAASKAFISQTELDPLVEVLGDGSDYAFFEDAHLFSVIKSGNVGFNRFDKACLVTLV